MTWSRRWRWSRRKRLSGWTRATKTDAAAGCGKKVLQTRHASITRCRYLHEDTTKASQLGSQDDPRMQEAVRLMESFLAIEDPQSRSALVKLAEGLVSCDWVRKAQQR